MLILQRVTQSEADCSDERQAGQIDEEQDSVIGCHMLYEPFEFDFMNIMKTFCQVAIESSWRPEPKQKNEFMT